MSKGHRNRKGRARSHGKGMGRGNNHGANKGSGKNCKGWVKTGLKTYNRNRIDLITPPPKSDGSPSLGTSISHHQSTIRVENQAVDIQSLPISKDIRTRDNKINRRASHFVAVIDSQKCMNCGACQDVCPNDAISINKTAMINQALCKACGQCVEECPTEAITLGEF